MLVVFFEDEANKILYIFGPSGFVRQGFKNSKSDELHVVEFEDGPYIGLGDEILSGKFALTLGITYEEGIPLVSVNYGAKPKKKKKRKNK